MAELMAAAWLAWAHRQPSVTKHAVDELPILRAGQHDRDKRSTIRLAVLGESSAVGFPFQNWLNVGHIVAWQLHTVMPDHRFEVDLIATPGDTLEGQHQKLTRYRARPDVLIVYCGHNEFAAHTPTHRSVHHYLDEQRPAWLGGWRERLARISPLHRLIRETADKFGAGMPPTAIDRRSLVDAPSFTPAEFSAKLSEFRSRLDSIVAYAESVGALPILVIPPANDADYEPYRSYLRPETTRAEREAFALAFQVARMRELEDPDLAFDDYARLLEQQPGCAEVHFRLARLLSQRGSWEVAYQHYMAARDADGHPVRCLSAFQQAYRDVAAHHGCILVDGQAIFHTNGRHGLLDDHLFNDAMHPSLVGHVALAQAILDGIQCRDAFDWPVGRPTPRIDIADCATYFGLDINAWKSVCEQGAMFYYGTSALRYDQNERRAKQKAFTLGVARIVAGTLPEAVGLPSIGVHAQPGD